MTTTATGTSRRTVLKAGALGASAIGAGSLAGVSPLASAMPNQPQGRLVVVYLRGGQDHLSTVIPYTDGNYYDRRPDIAIPDDRVLPLDSALGLHPVMTGLHSLYQAGRLAVVAGAGNPAGDRSHFAAQDLSEFGTASIPADQRGWIGRLMASTASADDSLFRAVSASALTSVSLRGYDALAVPTINQFGLSGTTGLALENEGLLRAMYAGAGTLESVGTSALDASAAISNLSGDTGTNVTAARFADIPEILEADLGVEAITIDVGGWDTHNPMGTWDQGVMRAQLARLNFYLSGMQADLDARGLDDVTTVVMTEFGRRVDQNGTQGTEHGWGSVMLVFGGGVNGGNVVGGVPSLSSANTPRGDVPVAVDFRDVLGELATSVLGVTDLTTVFPGHSPTPVGVMN